MLQYIFHDIYHILYYKKRENLQYCLNNANFIRNEL
jgi:hypothetical protein